MAETNGDKATGQALKEKLGQVGEKVQNSQTWAAIFRPGSIFRKGYTDSPRNRSYRVRSRTARAMRRLPRPPRQQIQPRHEDYSIAAGLASIRTREPKNTSGKKRTPTRTE